MYNTKFTELTGRLTIYYLHSLLEDFWVFSICEREHDFPLFRGNRGGLVNVPHMIPLFLTAIFDASQVDCGTQIWCNTSNKVRREGNKISLLG